MEKKVGKRILAGVGFLFAALVLTGCTKSFCTPDDAASMYADYVSAFAAEDKNQTSILNAASEAKYLVPDSAYWAYLDAKVDSVYEDLNKEIEADIQENGISSATTEDAIAGFAANFTPDYGDVTDTDGSDSLKRTYANVAYVRSYYEVKAYAFAHNVSMDSEDAYFQTRVNTSTLKGNIRFGGVDENSNTVLWLNFDNWTRDIDARDSLKDLRDTVPTASFASYYKSAFSSHIGTAVTCITPTSGYFGASEKVYISGKGWGEAFSKYGFIEGLLVYPIGWLVYTFANSFGATGANAWGQILAIFLTTLIVRLLIVLLSVGSQSSQSKMTELQPQIQALQAKYPNSQTNQAEQQQLAQETMALYKKNKIHPFRQILVLIIQFPIFIAVWSALQGSAILTRGSIFGLSLSTITQTAMGSHSAETPFAIVLFVIMAISQFFASMLPMWMQNWKKKQMVGTTIKVQEDQGGMGSMMKWMPIIMMVFVIIMGLQLPAAMAIYWIFGALISIFQTIITEIVTTVRRNKKKGGNNSFKGGDHFNKHGAYKSQSAPRQKHMKLR